MEEEKIPNEKNQEIFTKQVKVRKIKIGPLIFIIIVVLILIGCSATLFTYNRFVNDPAKIFTKAINVIYKDFHTTLKDVQEMENTYFNVEDNSLSFEQDITLDGTFMNFNQLKDNIFNLYYGVDYKNELVTMRTSVKENDTNLLNGAFYFKEKKMYLESDTLFNNTYSTDLEENIFESINMKELYDSLDGNNYSINDLDNTVKELKDALIASLDKDSMSISKEQIEVNNEKIKTNKISYKLNKESTKKLFSSFAQIILDNEELLKNLSKILEVNKEELTNFFGELMDDKSYDDFTNEDNFEFIIYTTGFTYKFVKAEIIEEKAKLEFINFKETHKLTFNDFEENDIYEVNLKMRNGIATLLVTNNKEQIIKLVFKEYRNEKIDVEYEIKMDDAKFKGELISEVDSISKTGFSGTIKFTCDMKSGSESYDLKVISNYKSLVGTKIEANKLDKAIDMKDFKDEDAKKTEEALKNIENSNFYKYIQNLSNYNNPSVIQNPTI